MAIGRAIVREPKVFLFDEPLSNLDAALRVQMRLEIAKLQKTLGTTAIYVTHDQVEAMTMADKIVVLNAGHVEQFGTPLELYERPANLFVAGFIGSPKMNFVSKQDIAGQFGAASIGVRPEHIVINRNGQGWPGRIAIAEHLGSDTFFYVESDVGRITVRTAGELGSAHRRPGPAQSRSGPRPPFRHGWQGDSQPSVGDFPVYLEKYKLEGRVALVTGGGRGIGAACVDALSEAGAKVVIAEIDQQVAEESRDALKAMGREAEIVLMNVADPKRVAEVANALIARHGKLDILVNNAGIARSETAAETVTDEHWLNVIDVNLNGVFWCCRAFGKHMLERRSGHHRQYRLDVGLHRQQAARAELLQRLQGRRASPDEVSRGRMGLARRPGQRGGADLYQHTAQLHSRARTRRCSRHGST